MSVLDKELKKEKSLAAKMTAENQKLKSQLESMTSKETEIQSLKQKLELYESDFSFESNEESSSSKEMCPTQD
jgi:cell shape-determining protein MreC